MRRTCVASFLGLMLVGVTAGCGGPVSVQGKVMMDGQPLPHATVKFIPIDAGENRGRGVANAMTDQAGDFRLQTINIEGALPGTYRVLISKVDSPRSMGELPRETLPDKYTQLAETPFEIEIPDRGKKDLLFELSSK